MNIIHTTAEDIVGIKTIKDNLMQFCINLKFFEVLMRVSIKTHCTLNKYLNLKHSNNKVLNNSHHFFF